MNSHGIFSESSLSRHGRLTPVSREQGSEVPGTRDRVNQSSICLSNWSARETPRMDGGYAAEIGGGR